ncbi:MAG: tRNA pseudouridine(38-40) synthase TruA [Alphaproteobacteria bacterium]
MPRYRLLLEYDGAPFVGWQRQDNGPSVQAALEQALLAFCGERITVFGAGRTDAGVHAAGQVAHCDIAKPTTTDVVRDALNHHLRPDPIAVLAVEPVDDDFNARFSAMSRRYCYRILNRSAPPALDRGQLWWISQPLDTDAMAAGARHLLGHHDFTSFRTAKCQARSPVKTLDRLEVTRLGEEVQLTVEARSFLHNQVRIMAGTLALVGRGRYPPGGVAKALAARDRRAAGPTAPAHGLCLMGVDY